MNNLFALFCVTVSLCIVLLLRLLLPGVWSYWIPSFRAWEWFRVVLATGIVWLPTVVFLAGRRQAGKPVVPYALRGILRTAFEAALVVGIFSWLGQVRAGWLPRGWLPGAPGWARLSLACLAFFVVVGGVFGVIGWVVSWAQFWMGVYDPFRRMGRARGGGWLDRFSRRYEAWLKFGRGATGGWGYDAAALCRDDVFLGRRPFSVRPVGISTERHFLTIGQTGSGKSSAVAVPNLCFHNGSALILDPKGELAEITAARRGEGGDGVEGMGQDVHILDPFGIVKGAASASYNVFDEMARVAERDADRPVSYAGKIAEALIKIEGEKEPYWDNAARTLVRGLVLYIFQGPPERRNLTELRRLIMEGDNEEWERQPAEIREKVTPFEMLLEKMKRAPAGPCRDATVGAASSLLAMGRNQMGGVLTTAQEHTSFLDAPEIRRVCANSDFVLDDLKRKPTSVYLCLPINMVGGKEGRWMRMFVVVFIDMMMRSKDRPKRPILLAIDEFPALGLEGADVWSSTLRSFGVRLWLAGQGLSQFKAAYPKTWHSIIGGAEAVQFLGVTEPETVRFVSERLGKHIIRGYQATGGRREPVFEEQPVMDAEQVARFLSPDLRNQIVWRGNRRPMKLKVTPYYDYLPRRYYTPDARFAA